MLTSEIRTELASTHMNVDNVCELTSTRLRTDQRYLRTDRRRLRNDRWRNDSLAKRPTFYNLCTIALLYDVRSPTERLKKKIVNDFTLHMELLTGVKKGSVYEVKNINDIINYQRVSNRRKNNWEFTFSLLFVSKHERSFSFQLSTCRTTLHHFDLHLVGAKVWVPKMLLSLVPRLHGRVLEKTVKIIKLL